MCSCKIGSMARRKTSVSLSQEDILFAIGGALGGMALNGVLNKALESQPENTRNTIAKVIPAAKLVGGGYLAMNKKTDRKFRFLGIGMSVTGGIELGAQFAPDYFGIGSAADVFALTGTNNDILALPIVPSAPLEREFDTVMGTGYSLESDTAVL